MFCSTSIISEQMYAVKLVDAAAGACGGLAGHPLHQVARFRRDPIEALSVRDQQCADDEDCQSELSHGASIPRRRRDVCARGCWEVGGADVKTRCLPVGKQRAERSDEVRQPGRRFPAGEGGRPVALRPRLSPGMPLSEALNQLSGSTPRGSPHGVSAARAVPEPSDRCNSRDVWRSRLRVQRSLSPWRRQSAQSAAKLESMAKAVGPESSKAGAHGEGRWPRVQQSWTQWRAKRGP